MTSLVFIGDVWGFKSFHPQSNYPKTKQNDSKFKGHSIFCMSASLEYIKYWW